VPVCFQIGTFVIPLCIQSAGGKMHFQYCVTCHTFPCSYVNSFKTNVKSLTAVRVP